MSVPRPYDYVPSPRRSSATLAGDPEPNAGPLRAPVRWLGRVAASNSEALAGWAIDALLTTVVTAGGVCLTKSGAAVLAFDPTITRIDASVTVFWICTVLAPLLCYAKFRAAKATAASVEDRIADERAAVLEDTDELLATAAVTQGLLHETYTQALGRRHDQYPATAAVQLLDVDIRIALSTVTTLVTQVEPPRPGSQIAANLMYFVEIDAQHPTLPPRVQDALILEEGKRIEDQRGAIFLEHELSSCTEVESGERDPNLHDLAFYIPRHRVDARGDGVLQMLPGSAYAFVSREMIATTPDQLIALCRDGSHAVSEKAGNDLERYFHSNAGRGIRSIVCHPLMNVDGKQPRAVLNIHSNYDGMLADPERRKQLYYLLRPWTLVLLRLLETRLRYAELAGGPSADGGGSLASPPQNRLLPALGAGSAAERGGTRTATPARAGSTGQEGATLGAQRRKKRRGTR